MPDIVHEAGISMLENGRLRHGSYCAISFLMHCLVFSELLEAQTSFKSDHVLMFLELTQKAEDTTCLYGFLSQTTELHPGISVLTPGTSALWLQVG